jgi:hypothetical protein
MTMPITVKSRCHQAIANIPKMPAAKNKLLNQKISGLFPVKLTRECALFSSTPVSESNTSLLKFSQAIIKIADIKKVENIAPLIILVSAKATAVPIQIGMIATLYMGGLMAASHNLLFDWSIKLVVIRQN